MIITENAPLPLRGELTRWLLELKPGVFAGSVSAMVRQKLWEKVCEGKNQSPALLLYSAQNEQGFEIEMNQEPMRRVVDLDGVKLIKIAT